METHSQRITGLIAVGWRDPKWNRDTRAHSASLQLVSAPLPSTSGQDQPWEGLLIIGTINTH